MTDEETAPENSESSPHMGSGKSFYRERSEEQQEGDQEVGTVYIFSSSGV